MTPDSGAPSTSRSRIANSTSRDADAALPPAGRGLAARNENDENRFMLTELLSRRAISCRAASFAASLVAPKACANTARLTSRCGGV